MEACMDVCKLMVGSNEVEEFMVTQKRQIQFEFRQVTEMRKVFNNALFISERDAITVKEMARGSSPLPRYFYWAS